MDDRFEITLNGERVVVTGQPADRSLLDHLRSIGFTGSKQGCAEGDCGACSVALVDTDARGERALRAINACITLLPMVAGREIVTVEGVGRGDRWSGEGCDLHPVQQALVEHGGSQCGYCTPGFTVSMLEGYHREGLSEPWQIADQLSGNLCRCTGYRPIRDAMAAALARRGARGPLRRAPPQARARARGPRVPRRGADLPSPHVARGAAAHPHGAAPRRCWSPARPRSASR